MKSITNHARKRCVSLTKRITELHHRGYSDDFYLLDELCLACTQNNRAFSRENITISLVDQGYDEFSECYKYIYSVDTHCGERGVLLADSPLLNAATGTAGFSSLLLRQQLETKLYHSIHTSPVQPAGPGDFAFLCSNAGTGLGKLIALKAALQTWSAMETADRHSILAEFLHYNKLSVGETGTHLTYRFCRLFLRDFVTVLSGSGN